MSVKTPVGFTAYAEYIAGHELETADELFTKLKGRRKPDNSTTLYIDLMEKIGEVPVSACMIGCTLDELTENCKFLALHAFRMNSLKS